MKLKGNILVITSWSFKDALVQTYTLPYINIIREIIPAGKKIFLVTEEQKRLALTADELDNINREWAAKNIQLITLPYRRFGWKKILAWPHRLYRLYRLIKTDNIKVIHAFCTPAGSIAYLLSRLSGIPFILDSFEPHAESMVENGTWRRNSLAHRILFLLEKKQTKRAVHLIGTTAGMKDYAKEKFGVAVKSFFVKPACVDLELFFPREKNQSLLSEFNLQDKLVCVYAGKLGGIYFKEEVFDFIKACYNHWGDKFRFLILTNATEQEISGGMQRAGLPPAMVIRKFVFHKEVPDHLSLGDFALNPVKPVPTKRYCTSIKDGEYWAMGLPVVISPGISDDSAILAEEETGVVVDFTSKNDIGTAILKIDHMLQDKGNLIDKIRELAIKHRSFDIARNIYVQIYNEQ